MSEVEGLTKTAPTSLAANSPHLFGKSEDVRKASEILFLVGTSIYPRPLKRITIRMIKTTPPIPIPLAGPYA
jgi:hypothetical protein